MVGSALAMMFQVQPVSTGSFIEGASACPTWSTVITPADNWSLRIRRGLRRSAGRGLLVIGMRMFRARRRCATKGVIRALTPRHAWNRFPN